MSTPAGSGSVPAARARRPGAPAPAAAVQREPIDPAQVLSRVGAPSDGAVLLFLGTVRDHADGRPVGGMRYETYEAMAAEVLDEIVREAAERLGTPRVAVVHRVGELGIGDVSVAIAVSSPHRESAYAASRHVIEEIKSRLPVWKHEHFVGGGARWVEGRPLDPRSGSEAESAPGGAGGR
ncbi:MAG: molybdenum cofactor biosynthesis protein MoaE [Gemmatimonadota bacterium]|nr:molybdenum cofactor biosynthesis protein MoaE [Gemmatimonadota bacterium]